MTPSSAPVIHNKVVKAMAIKDFKIAIQKREIGGLKQQLEAVQPSNKRARVDHNPQEQFADIQAIKKA
jgi:ABC-type phosphate transport system auxiliary subunit